jgi:uncharacterized protein
MRTIFKAATFLVVFVLSSCVTVNVYFPAAEVQRAADKIVDDVRTKGEKSVEPVPGPSSGLDFFKRFSLGTSEVYAQVNIDVSSPAIRGIREAMKNRFSQLKPFYDSGAVGESNKGLVEARDAGLSLQDKSRVNKLVDQENKDRTALYSEIATANKLGPESVLQIQKLFANSWRGKSHPGWWVQGDDGTWEKQK